MTTLRYRSLVGVEDLAVGECTVHVCSKGGARWWMLWALVTRETATPQGPVGSPLVWGVPIAPNGAFNPSGPGGKTWGLTRVGAGRWQISPSINVLVGGDVHSGPHPDVSQWHQTPAIEGVPDGEPWAIGISP